MDTEISKFLANEKCNFYVDISHYLVRSISFFFQILWIHLHHLR